LKNKILVIITQFTKTLGMSTISAGLVNVTNLSVTGASAGAVSATNFKFTNLDVSGGLTVGGVLTFNTAVMTVTGANPLYVPTGRPFVEPGFTTDKLTDSKNYSYSTGFNITNGVLTATPGTYTATYSVVRNGITTNTTRSIIVNPAYYFDSIMGNDTSNSGISMNSPWKNISLLDISNNTAPVILPGTSINFKTNSVWSGKFRMKGTGGVSGNVVVIDQYSIDLSGNFLSGLNAVGEKPLINGNGLISNSVREYSTVYFENKQYLEINNLEITNYPLTDISNGTPWWNPTMDISGYWFSLPLAKDPNQVRRAGLTIDANKPRSLIGTNTINHVYIKNCYVHHIKGQSSGTGFGIRIQTSDTSATGFYTDPTNFNDILVQDCEVSYIEGQGLHQNYSAAGSGGTPDNFYPGVDLSGNDWNPFWNLAKSTNVVIKNNIFHHLGKNAILVRGLDSTCLIDGNTCYETSLASAGNTIVTFKSDGLIVQNNEGYYNRSTSQTVDPGAISGNMLDFDYGSRNIIFQYNYSHENSQGCISMYNLHSWTPGPLQPGPASGKFAWPSDNLCTFRYNISIADGYANPSQTDPLLRWSMDSSSTNYTGLICWNFPDKGTEVYNNLFYIPPGYNVNIMRELGNYPQSVFTAEQLSVYNSFYYNFYNNIVYNAGTEPTELWFVKPSSTGLLPSVRNFFNNILYGGYKILGTDASNCNFVNNKYSNPFLQDPFTEYKSVYGGHLAINHPGYKLISGSLALGTGTILGTFNDLSGSVIGYDISQNIVRYDPAVPHNCLDYYGNIDNTMTPNIGIYQGRGVFSSDLSSFALKNNISNPTFTKSLTIGNKTLTYDKLVALLALVP